MDDGLAGNAGRSGPVSALPHSFGLCWFPVRWDDVGDVAEVCGSSSRSSCAPEDGRLELEELPNDDGLVVTGGRIVSLQLSSLQTGGSGLDDAAIIDTA